MCTILIAYEMHADFPLIVLANRDEYYSRPSLPASYWVDFPEIYAGRDLIGGGTWLGLTRSGRFAAVTNYRDPNAPSGVISRGNLVAEHLKSYEPPLSYLERVRQTASMYSGFNLIVGELSQQRQQLFYYSNRASEVIELKKGVYGLSNHLLDTPWPKVTTGKMRLNELLVNGISRNNEFFEILANTMLAEDADLPSTGIPLEAEKALSSIFIKTPNYGTRCSTVIKFDMNFEWTFDENVAFASD